MVKRATRFDTQAAKSSSAKRFRRSAICREFDEREVLKASTQVYFKEWPETPCFTGFSGLFCALADSDAVPEFLPGLPQYDSECTRWTESGGNSGGHFSVPVATSLTGGSGFRFAAGNESRAFSYASGVQCVYRIVRFTSECRISRCASFGETPDSPIQVANE